MSTHYEDVKKSRCQLSKFGIIRKTDFTNHDAWNRLVCYLNNTRDTLKLLSRKNSRLHKRIKTLQEMTEVLKKEKLLSESADAVLEVGSHESK